jgi:hypothetical protein
LLIKERLLLKSPHVWSQIRIQQVHKVEEVLPVLRRMSQMDYRASMMIAIIRSLSLKMMMMKAMAKAKTKP